MSRSRTTKRKSSRRLSAKTQRLVMLARRVGIVVGVVVFVLWLGAWVVLSGAVSRGALWVEHKAYDFASGLGFTVEDILVEGRVNTDADVLRALINIEKGDPLFAFNPAEARELIERIAWVNSAHVERRLPDTIYIRLTERVPLALWQNKGKIRVIDEEGVTLTDSELLPFKNLIIVVGEDAPAKAPALIDLLNAEPLLKARVEAASRVGDRRWDLTLKSGIKVKLPEDDAGFALRRLAVAQEDDGLLDKDLTVIDARESDRLIVRTRPGAVETYKAGRDL